MAVSRFDEALMLMMLSQRVAAHRNGWACTGAGRRSFTRRRFEPLGLLLSFFARVSELKKRTYPKP